MYHCVVDKTRNGDHFRVGVISVAVQVIKEANFQGYHEYFVDVSVAICKVLTCDRQLGILYMTSMQ